MQLRRHGYRWIAVFLSVLPLSACVTPLQTRALLHTPPDIPVASELTSVPFYPQKDYQCGPAALATVINHYQPVTSAEQLIPLVYIPQLKGSLQVEMLAAPSQFGRLAIPLDGKLQSVLREVAGGNPVLVLQNLGFDAYPFWHYAVVVGYDLQQQHIILRSGEIPRLVRPLGVFERTWQRSGYWSAVVVPPDVMPVTLSEDQFVKAALAFEPGGMPDSVALTYQNGVKRWPRNFILQMGLGNALFRLEQFPAAENAFRAAINIAPERAEAWNNLGYALVAKGSRQQALEAVEQAIRLQPEQQAYRDSHAEILNQ